MQVYTPAVSIMPQHATGGTFHPIELGAQLIFVRKREETLPKFRKSAISPDVVYSLNLSILPLHLRHST